MSASKTKRARKARKKSAKKTGLVALAAAALASPVATMPVIAQSPSSVSPQPSPPSSTETEIDREMGTIGPKGAEIPLPSPGAEAIGPPCNPKEPGAAPTIKDKAQTTPLQPGATSRQRRHAINFQPIPKADPPQTIILKPKPAAPSTKGKALIYTGPSKPSR